MKQRMGYCRCGNTLSVMRECFKHAEDQLSGREAAARIAVAETAEELLMGLEVGLRTKTWSRPVNIWPKKVRVETHEQ